MVRCEQEETGDFGPVKRALLLLAFGELVLWIKGLFIDIWKCGLLPAFRFSVSYPVHIEHPLTFTHQRMH